jgi:hypothetical protein
MLKSMKALQQTYRINSAAGKANMLRPVGSKQLAAGAADIPPIAVPRSACTTLPCSPTSAILRLR